MAKPLMWEFVKGLIAENPTFRIVLGLCPTLAVSTSLDNAIGMGAAATFVLFGSNTMISLIRKRIPDRIRIPIYIVVIASFVTMVSLAMQAYTPGLNKALGIYVPLIVVNCIILGRMEAFAGKNPIKNSLADAFGMGLGFTWALVLLGAIREFLGFGAIFGFKILGSWYPQMVVMRLPTGAFITLGLLIAMMNIIRKQKAEATCHAHEGGDKPC